MVTLRGLNWKIVWDNLVRMSQQLEALGVDDGEADNV